MIRFVHSRCEFRWGGYFNSGDKGLLSNEVPSEKTPGEREKISYVRSEELISRKRNDMCKGPEVGMNLAISSNKTSECLDQRFCVGCRHWYGGCQ